MEHTLVLLCAVIGGSLAFLPSPSPSLVSITHADITEDALLTVALETCKAVLEAEGKIFTPPLSKTPEGVLRACLGGSVDSDEVSMVSAAKFRQTLDEVITENILVDRDHIFSTTHHFTDEDFSGRDLITEGVVSIRASLRAESLEAARRRLGQISHTLQDFYSHSNWFELGNMNPYTSLLRPDLPLENIADFGMRTCSDSDILKTDKLTSGYLVFSRPSGKCSHGGYQEPINKDFGGGALTPEGVDPHLAAARSATLATMELLQDIRNSAGDTLFLRMLGISRSVVVCFVLDTTGSMSDDFPHVIRLAYKIIDQTRGTQNEPSEYILVQFNDPVVGPVTRTKDPDVMKQLLKAIKVKGGGDGPEPSLAGIRLALTTAPPSSDIFVFTDAPAKDTELEGAVRSLIDSTKSKVSFLLTNLDRRRRRRRSTVTNLKNTLYEELARASGGLAIEVTKDTLSQATGVILDSITSALVTLLQVSRNSGTTESFPVLVDPSVQNLTIYLTGLSVSFTVESPSGMSQGSSEESGPLGVVSSVGNLQQMHLSGQNHTGVWQINITATQPYNLKVTGRSVLDFVFQFVEVFQGPHPGFVLQEGRPPAGPNATLLVTVTGADFLSDVGVGFVSGSEMLNGTVQGVGRGAFLFSVPRLPGGPFTLVVRGKDDGEPFQRQSTNQLQASQVTVQVQSTATLEPGIALSVPFTVATSGVGGNFTIRADQNFVTSFTPSVTVGADGPVNGSVSLLALVGTLSGSAATVTIEAESADTRQSNYALLRLSVITRVTDFTSPVCRVLNESADCSALCSNAHWEITAHISDGNGTGVQQVFTRNGNGSLATSVVQDEDGANVTLVTYNSTCCSVSVEIIAVDAVGNSGTCSYTVRTMSPPTSTPPSTTPHSSTPHSSTTHSSTPHSSTPHSSTTHSSTTHSTPNSSTPHSSTTHSSTTHSSTTHSSTTHSTPNSSTTHSSLWLSLLLLSLISMLL